MTSLSVALTVASVVASVVLGEDDASCFPQPGEPRLHPSDCCNMQGFMPDNFKPAFMKCVEQYPKPPKPAGPPPTGPPPPPTPEMKEGRACMAECVFAETNLLTPDKALDPDAIKKLTPNNTAFAAAVEAAKGVCLASYKKDIDTSVKCTSGAHEFKHCMGREVFKNCPASTWTASAECDALKAKVDRCPGMPIKGPKGHHRN